MKKLVLTEKGYIILLLILSLFLMLIRPIFFPNIVYVPDAEEYAKLVKVFRGNGKIEDVSMTFRSRILVPFIASLLPWDPFICLIIVNIIFALFSVYLFNRFLINFDFSEKKRILGTLLFVIAGPTIIIGSLPITDSAELFFITLVLYLFRSLKNNLKKDLLIGIVIGVGILARETIIFIAPIIILWNIMDVEVHWKLLFRYIIFIGLIPIMSFILIKVIILTTYIWAFEVVQQSLILGFYLRINFFKPLLLGTFAQISLLFLVGIFGNYSKIITKEKIIWKLIIGMAFYSLLIIWGLIIGQLAARFFWPLYVFIIPFFLLALNGDNFS